MAYSFQVYSVGQVLTAANMNQEEVNTRDHIHGVAGVLDPQTLKPQADNTYDLGTSALRWRNAYVSGFTAKIRNLTEEFLTLPNPLVVVYSLTSGTSSIVYTAQSHGLGILSAANAGNLAVLMTSLKAHPSDWSQLACEAWANVENLDPAAIIHMVGLMTDGSSDGMYWVNVNSGFLRPRNRIGGATTDGADVAVAVNSLQQLRVETTVNTSTFYLNGVLKQGLSTNITSSRVMGTAGFHTVTGTQRFLYLDYLSFEVVP